MVVAMVRCVIGAVFIASGLGKVFAGQEFARTLKAFGIPSFAWAFFLGRWLAYCELAVGLLMVLHFGSPWPERASITLFLLFGLAVALRILAGPLPRNCGCGCFGKLLQSKISWALVFRNIGCAALATTLVADSQIVLLLLGGLGLTLGSILHGFEETPA